MKKTMRYCTHCLEPDTRPGQSLDDSGLCVPCQFSHEKVPVDWDSRREELRRIVEWAKINKKGKYDCVLGVSGGKDSTRLAFYCREVGMEPLLVSYVPVPELLTDVGAYNLANLVEHDFDVETFNVAPNIMRKLMKKAFIEEGNFLRATEMALVATMPRTAIRHNIPLICGGENPYVTMGSSSGSTDGEAKNITSMNTLNGGDLSPFYMDGVSEINLNLFRIPKANEIDNKGLRFIFLGYYMESYDPTNNVEFAKNHGMRVREGIDADPYQTGCHHSYASLEDDLQFVNHMLKYVKLGFGFASQQLSLDVRAGRLTRDEAVRLALEYDGNCAQRYIDIAKRYFAITDEEFWDVVEKFRNKDIWNKNDGKWELSAPLK